MTTNNRINAFVKLGNLLKSNYGQQLIEEWAYKAYQKNNWFTPENSINAINSIANYYLEEQNLNNWVSNYDLENIIPKMWGWSGN